MILGIDPGLENTGYAIVDNEKLIECGVVKVGKGDMRLKDLYEELEKIIKKYKMKTRRSSLHYQEIIIEKDYNFF
jgi:Holliday junction resolvasome RuvABC endonuclease subunit